MSLESDYLKWRRGPEVGCVFARLIAHRPDDYNQAIKKVASGGTPNRVAGNISRCVQRLVANEAITAGALLLPELTSLDELTKIALALGERPNWSITVTHVQNPPIENLVAFHLIREIPFGNDKCPSEVLVFGPFQEFPPTRQAPTTAMELFVGEPLSHDPKAGTPSTRANLAHMDLPMVPPNAFNIMWEKSIDGRLKSLGTEDSRAKAKISFVVPTPLAENLGCVP